MAESREEFAESTSSAFNNKKQSVKSYSYKKINTLLSCADELASRLCLHSFAKVVIFF